MAVIANNGEGSRGEGAGRRVARNLLMLFYASAGVAHFAFVDAMAKIVPSAVPAPRLVVLVTGACEIAGAAALAIPTWRRAAGRALALYALCVWPANVRHALLDLSHGTGLPVWYHVPRLLLQPAIIWWALWSVGAVRSSRATR